MDTKETKVNTTFEGSNEGIRINKYLSQAGVLSRRKADEAVDRGDVTINGRVAISGDKVNTGDVVEYLGKPVTVEKVERVILAYNKPLGLVCTSKEADKDSIFRKLDYPDMLYYVGRLDKNSQGLLLLTNDGELANQIQKARNNHEKEYVVRVDKPLTAAFVKGMMGGVPLEVDGEDKIRVTKECVVEQIGKNTFRIIITEGINRQIRRMCEHFGYRVTFLKRVRVMNIPLGNLPLGHYRKLSANEEKTLREMCK
ncbi:MAG: pseudouridine synthase [Eubacterium sp.]|nr:pseudouridine synthase [Eubacterium sp.]